VVLVGSCPHGDATQRLGEHLFDAFQVGFPEVVYGLVADELELLPEV